jgi:hypothetical protein
MVFSGPIHRPSAGDPFCGLAAASNQSKSRPLTYRRRWTRTAQECNAIGCQAVRAGLLVALDAATSQGVFTLHDHYTPVCGKNKR